MPEGDTIHKIANFLKPRLTDQVVNAVALAPRFDAGPSRGRRPSDQAAGRSVTDVVARGKHLFIEFDNALALRSHLGMYGSWHFYAHGAAWKKPRKQASLVLTTDETVYVCFNAKEVEWVAAPSVRERVIDMRLGPDLTAGAVDLGAVVRRAREFQDPDAPLVDVLLDQRVACGIGNVYKSELLFIQRHPPLTRLADVSDESLGECFGLAADLLGSNLGGGKRVTRREKDDAGRLWVYGRGGAPCLRCDDTIRYARLGQHHRGTYWCPACQGD
jgi:endonuclease-8